MERRAVAVRGGRAVSYLASPVATILLLALVCRLAGGRADRGLATALGRGPGADPRLRPLRCWILGLASLVLILFAAAALGALRPLPLLLMAVAILIAAAVTEPRERWAEALRGGTRRALGIPCTAVAVLTVPLALLAASPTVSWDAASYHLAVPQLYLGAGGFRAVPANVYASWPLGIDLLFAPALLFGGVAAAKLVHWGLGMLILVAMAAALSTAGRHRPATVAIAFLLLLANPLVGFEMRVAYVDLGVALSFLAGAVFAWRARDLARERSRCLGMVGIAAALLVSVKLTGILLAGIVVLLALPALLATWRGERRELRGGFLALTAPVATALVLWGGKAWWETGNPVYPFFHDLFGGPWWRADLTARLADWQRSIGMGRELTDYLLLPGRVFWAGGEGYDRFDGQLSPVWLVLVPVTLVWAVRSRSREARLSRRALVAAGLVFAQWALTAQQMRFLLPAVPLLAVAAAAGLEALVRHQGRGPWGRRTASLRAFGLVAAFVLVVHTHGPLLLTGYRLALVYHRVPADQLLASAEPAIAATIEARVPTDARILLLGTNQRFFIPREVLADSFLEVSQIAAWLESAGTPAEVRRRLADEAIDHVLVDPRAAAVAYPAPLWQLLGDPTAAETLHAEPGGPLLLRLNPLGAGEPRP